MSDKTKIEWTDATWNVINGCTLVDDGCKNCYAATMAGTRLKNHPSREGLTKRNAAGGYQFNGQVRFIESELIKPLHWRKPRMVFVCAHGDLFHEDVPDEWIDRVFAVMAGNQRHTFQVLTKRPDRAHQYLTKLMDRLKTEFQGFGGGIEGLTGFYLHGIPHDVPKFPLPNVWLGTSISDQPSADKRIPELLATPAAVRFVSAEPLLGPVDLTMIWADNPFMHLNTLRGSIFDRLHYRRDLAAALDWVIVGGESGKNARPMHPDWARSLRDQCEAAGVAFFFKQWGEWISIYDRDRDDPDWRNCPKSGDWDKKRYLNLEGGQGFHGDKLNMMQRVGKRAAGRLLDGREWNQMTGDV
ncbi:phage Gp37/Gp68 family protein [Roseobacter sp. TSBP12]|uniref:phage Gp37/Gp68 family protein n=1 Tax=Roseobacter sp. TSBP12 TaxID=1236613 RepID=UPI00125F598B|nr:phage Gp37/Gp68 family protein [Roseobacter sp. TSBP12]KAB6717745.1 phage Gp37/Gp68 family protein [Roseobacter sp. TSBP12]